MRNVIQLIFHSSARMCVTTWASVQAKSQTIHTFRFDLRKDVKQSFRAVPFSRFSNKLLFCIGVGDCLLDMLPVSNVFQWSSAACFFCGLCVLLLELLAFSSWELERFIPGWFLRNLSWMVAVGWMKINQYEGHVEPTLHCDMPEMPYPLMAQASLELSGSMRLLRLSFCMLCFKLCQLCFEFWLNLSMFKEFPSSRATVGTTCDAAYALWALCLLPSLTFRVNLRGSDLAASGAHRFGEMEEWQKKLLEMKWWNGSGN